MIIKSIGCNDVLAVSELHKKAFGNFFLTKLGIKFLINFYKAIFKDSDSINIGIFCNDSLIGFAVGSRRSKSFYRRILKNNFFKLIYPSILPLMLSPKLIFRLFRAFRSIRDSSVDSAVLLSICIDPEYGSKGCGKKLLTEFECLAFDFSKIISLTTDAEHNDFVNDFYRNNGYELNHTFFQGKRKMNYYIKYKNKLIHSL
jgi:GNAT superfamily N-acetyltransferase